MAIFFYLFHQFFYRLIEFFRHWYVGSFCLISHFLVSLFEKIDRVVALKINFRHFFEPLYQDRSFIGYIFGVFFRSWRILIGIIIYSIIGGITVIFYILWSIIPI